jgi:hypothetical protein
MSETLTTKTNIFLATGKFTLANDLSYSTRTVQPIPCTYPENAPPYPVFYDDGNVAKGMKSLIQFTNTPTSGNFKIGVSIDGVGVLTSDIAYNANAAAVTSALNTATGISGAFTATGGAAPAVFYVTHNSALTGHAVYLYLGENTLVPASGSVSIYVNANPEGSPTYLGHTPLLPTTFETAMYLRVDALPNMLSHRSSLTGTVTHPTAPTPGNEGVATLRSARFRGIGGSTHSAPPSLD